MSTKGCILTLWKKLFPATVEEMLKESKAVPVCSREFRILDIVHGIYGLIDEVQLTPESFIVIDDKPGTRTYVSNIRQVYGYCLAFRAAVCLQDRRQLIGALRERGTDNIYWRRNSINWLNKK